MRRRIMLVPNLAAWIIGDIGREIARLFGDRFDFLFVPESLFHRRPDLIQALLPSTDLIHCLTESGAPLVFRVAGGEPAPPLITWIHHVTAWSGEHEFAAQRSVAIVASTPGWKQEIERLNPYRRPTHAVRYGVDGSMFQPLPDARAKFGLPQDGFVLGFFGTAGSDRDGGRKGIPTLLEVVRAAAPRIPKAHIVFAGPGWHGVVEDLRASGMSASYTDFVRRSDMPYLYSSLDAYLMTSRVEGGPCTILESMACATPVVATRVGLVPDVVEDGVSGFTAQVDDVAALVEGLVTLAADSARAKQMGANGRLVAEHHSWSRNLAPLAELYEGYARKDRPGQCTRPWMSDPLRLLRPACAADALSIGWDKARREPRKWLSNLRTTYRMLDGMSVADCLEGAALLKRLSFRA